MLALNANPLATARRYLSGLHRITMGGLAFLTWRMEKKLSMISDMWLHLFR